MCCGTAAYPENRGGRRGVQPHSPGLFTNRERDVRQRQDNRPAAAQPCCQRGEDSGRSSMAADDAQMALAGRGFMNSPPPDDSPAAGPVNADRRDRPEPGTGRFRPDPACRGARQVAVVLERAKSLPQGDWRGTRHGREAGSTSRAPQSGASRAHPRVGERRAAAAAIAAGQRRAVAALAPFRVPATHASAGRVRSRAARSRCVWCSGF